MQRRALRSASHGKEILVPLGRQKKVQRNDGNRNRAQGALVLYFATVYPIAWSGTWGVAAGGGVSNGSGPFSDAATLRMLVAMLCRP